jgi:hypothetical protein
MDTLYILQCLFYGTGSFFFLGLLTAAILNLYIVYKFWMTKNLKY